MYFNGLCLEMIQGTLQRVFDSLPDVTMSVVQIGLSWTLSAFMPNEVSKIGTPVTKNRLSLININ